MPSGIKVFLLNCVGVAVLLTGIVVGYAFLAGEFSTLLQSFEELGREEQLYQELDANLHRIQEQGEAMERVVLDLIDQRCNLSEAVERYRASSVPADLQQFERQYPQAATEDERITQHLFYRISKRRERPAEMRAAVLARLRAETGLPPTDASGQDVVAP